MTTVKRRVEYGYLKRELARGTELRRSIFEDLESLFDEGDFTLGRRVEEFEEEFAAAVGAKHAVGVRSGTDAIALVLIALQRAGRLPEGARVAAPVNTFYATVGAILQANMKPILVDVGDDMLMDRRLALRLWRDGAIDAAVPVHWTGTPCVLDPAAFEGMPVVYDAAQAVGATWRDLPIGALGVASAYSLHPLKNVHAAGDGGVVTTDDPALAISIGRLRNHGLIGRNDWLAPGFNARLEPIQAVVARRVLQLLPAITNRRQTLALIYDSMLREIDGIAIPPRDELASGAFHTYVVQSESRDNLVHWLATERGIEAKVHYPKPLHMQPALASLGLKAGDFPVAEAQAERIVTLPVHEHLSEEDVRYVADSIRDFHSL